MKQCSKCKTTKEFSEFYKSKKEKDGHQYRCKTCCKKNRELYINKKLAEQHLKYRKRNREKLNSKSKLYYLENTELCKTSVKSYRENNKEKYRKYNRNYQNNRSKTDPLFKLSKNLRSRIWNFFKKSKTKGTEQLLGCTFEEAKLYLENQFTEGMSWQNYGEWHVDHIIPLASANTLEEAEKLCHYTNLQPLWAIDNFKKGNK